MILADDDDANYYTRSITQLPVYTKIGAKCNAVLVIYPFDE
jgi:hypothetical protein